jgi:hypothetical protein
MKKLKDVIDTIVEEAEVAAKEAEEVEEADEEFGTGDGRRRRGKRENPEEVRRGDDENEHEDEDEARNQERRRRQGKFTKRLSPILNLLSPDTIKTYFGTTNHKDIWRDLSTNASHRSKVIE